MKLELRWGALLVAIGGLVGCSREVEVQYVASKQAQTLSPELQQKIRHTLAKYCGTPTNPKMLGDEHVLQQHLLRGAAVFNQRCAACHGVTGDGAGPAADYLNPRPRDYRRGIFKFTSTPYGAKPRREDLIRTVRDGAMGTSMPFFRLLPEEDLQAVVDYVLALTHRGELELQLAVMAENDDEIDDESVPDLVQGIATRWRNAPSQVVMPVTHMTPATPESIAEGKQAFLSETAGCYKCHGSDGRGLDVDKASSAGFKDDWGQPARAADLSAGMFHGGRRPLDIYRRIYSGINGTPMPAFSLKLAEQPETFWDLVHYVEYISSARRRAVGETRPEAPPPKAPAPGGAG